MVPATGVGIDALRNRLPPVTLVPQHLEQRPYELGTADLGQESFHLRHCGLVAVGERQFEPQEQFFVIARTR